jgi:hypothetical protein
MDEQQKANKARIYGYLVGLVAVVTVVAWKLIAR